VTATVELHHRIDGDGPDLVLLHGGGGTAEELTDLRDRLAPSHRVISPEQRGHGRSPWAEPFTYPAMAADTAAVLERLGVRGADLVGWSDGAIVALLVARDRPDLVRRVVAIGADVDAGPGEASHLTPEAAAEQLALTPEQLGLDSRLAAALVRLWTTPHGIAVADLGSIAAPILFIAGDRDVITLEHTAAMFQAARDGRLAILPGADHAVPITGPAAVAELVGRFLAS
jgi:pimeloyl-ACP methyl ester carboxylesterase